MFECVSVRLISSKHALIGEPGVDGWNADLGEILEPSFPPSH
jgi:hypothetical protein